MDVESNITDKTKTLFVSKDVNKTHTRAAVLWDLKGSHVFLLKRKCLVRKDDIQMNDDSISCNSEEESKEKQNNAHANSLWGKLKSFELVEGIEGIQGLEKDGMNKTCYLGRLTRGSPEYRDQGNKKNIHTLDDSTALIDQYFETGTLHISTSNVFGVLRLAFELKLMDVYNACLLFLSHSLTVGNCIEIWRISKKFQSYSLTEQVMSFMEQHLTASLLRKDNVSVATSLIHSANDFHSLEFLLQIFSSHTYENTAKAKGTIMKLFSELMKQESMIWRFCFKQYLQQLEDGKLGQEDDSQSSKKLKKDSLHKRIKEGNAVNELVMSSERFGNKDLDNARDVMTLKIQKGKPMPMTRDVNISHEQRKGILVAGGFSDKTHEALDMVFLYEPEADTWTALPCLTYARFNHTMVTLNGKIFVMGGKRKSKERTCASYMIEGSKINHRRHFEQEHCSHNTMNFDTQQLGAGRQKIPNSNCHISISPNNSLTSYQLKESCENSWLDHNQMSSVEVFSTESNKWCEASSMILKRKEHSSVVVGDFVYVLGGHDSVTQLCSMEKYDPVKDEWTLEKPMSRLCTGMNVVTDRRFLYVLGGYSGDEWLNELSCYDTINKTWIDNNHPAMKTGRAFAGAELVADEMFIFGGVNSQGFLDECEVFNLTSQTWRQGPRMNQSRCNAGHCVFKTKIFVFGGEAYGMFLDTVEYLDIENWEWKMVKRMPKRTAGLRCAQTNVYSRL